ncbi:MAG TPA: hypothetical protein VGN88_04270 [Phycisphaerae bacterium]|jgi:hypothetical protein
MPLSVGDPIMPSLNRAGLMLFKPFKLRIWLVLALAVAMSIMGDGVAPAAGLMPQVAIRALRGFTFDQVLLWIQAHTMPIILWTLGLIPPLFVIYLLVRWISSRGHFILFDNIVNNTQRIRQPWHEFRELGNSLMKFRISWDLLIFNIYLVIFLISGVLEWPDFKKFLINGTFNATSWTTAAIISLIAGMLLAGIILFILSSLIFRMAIPVMYLRRIKAWPAVKLTWRELFKPNWGKCLAYFFFSIVIAMVGGMVTELGMIVLAVFTLCIGPALLYVPLIGNYSMALAGLPVAIFDAAYQLHFMAQFGPDYTIQWQVPLDRGFPVIVDSSPNSPVANPSASA